MKPAPTPVADFVDVIVVVLGVDWEMNTNA